MRQLAFLLCFTLATFLLAQVKAKAPASKADKKAGDKKDSGPTKVSGKPVTTPSGLKYWEIKKGSGATAVAGKHVSVHYTGWLADGKEFDSSFDMDEPVKFDLGSGKVIKGWDEGIAGMKVGGRRQLHIPPELGYGTRGAPPTIPPNATLIFDVQLVAVK